MIDQGFIHEYADLFRLDRYKEVITQMEGFGEKSYQNMMDSIETARHTTLPRLIGGLGIAGIGVANAKVLCRYFDYDLEKMQKADVETLRQFRCGRGAGDSILRIICGCGKPGTNRTSEGNPDDRDTTGG